MVKENFFTFKTLKMDKNFTKTAAPKYDLHLSAHAISMPSIKKLEKLGMVRDTFANNKYCDTTAYHATFPNWYPNEGLRDDIISILANDEKFNGGLEEEITLPHFRRFFTYEPDAREANADALGIIFEDIFPKKKAEKCPADRLKACDMHINVDWEYSGKQTKNAFDFLEIVSFDRPTQNKFGYNRIYTLTFESLANGVDVFEKLVRFIEMGNGTVLKFVGKVKLEQMTQIYRKPLDGTLLPLITKY